jgi:hypothetical protein
MTLHKTGLASLPRKGRPAAAQAANQDWHRTTQTAVVLAWMRDPDVMCDLVATLMDIHLHHCNRSTEHTLDELHLMISLELQSLSAEPD